MSSIGKEVADDASKFPVVDIINHHDLVTSAAVLQVSVFNCLTILPLIIHLEKHYSFSSGLYYFELAAF